jgi:hypothetical protein
MKQILLFSNRCLISGKCWAFVLLIVGLGSCKSIEYGVEASLDDSGQKYSGPSYDEPELSIFDLAYNLEITMEEWMFSGFEDNAMAAEKTTGGLGFMAHAGYVSKRSSQNFTGGKTTTRLGYLNVPLYLAYRTAPVKGSNFFGGIGPYFAYGLGGKFINKSNGRTDETPAFGSNGGFGRFDMGLGLTAGYKTSSSFSISLGYQLGLKNIESNAGGDKTKNRSFSLNFGYSLNKLLGK